MLTVIGAGLSSIDDMTLRGMKALEDSDYIYLDTYTSIMSNCTESIEKLTGKAVILADRGLMEQGDEIIDRAAASKVAIVVIGDPLSATTHTDILLRATERNIPFKVIHNASIMTAVGCCGLQLYNFGATVSIPFWDETSKPESFFDKVMWNLSHGLHTLCLLDIRVKERTVENILRDRNIYEPPRFMTCGNAANQIIDILQRRSSIDSTYSDVAANDFIAIGLARVGSEDQRMTFSALGSFSLDGDRRDCVDSMLGGPLHTLVIPGKLHPLEADFLLASCRLPTEDSASLPIFVSVSYTDKPLADAQALLCRHDKLVSSCMRNTLPSQFS